MKKSVWLVLKRNAASGGSAFRLWFVRRVCKDAFDMYTRELVAEFIDAKRRIPAFLSPCRLVVDDHLIVHKWHWGENAVDYRICAVKTIIVNGFLTSKEMIVWRHRSPTFLVQ